MIDYKFRKSFPFINSAVFTENNILLPLNDTEKINYYNKSTKFNLTLGNGAPAYTSRYNSYKGTLYLTNQRIVYRPNAPTNYFDSFSIGISDVLSVEIDYYFEIKVNEQFSSNVYVGFEDSHTNIFFDRLRNVLKTYQGKNFGENVYGSGELLPLYCEVVKEKKMEMQ